MAFAACRGESHPAPTPAAPKESKTVEIPTRRVTFSAGDLVSDLNVSPVLILPMQCTGDGALFFDMLQPPTFTKQALYALTKKSSRSFDISAASDLHSIELTSYFPTKNHVFVLVRATKETTPLSGETKVRQSKHGFFVIVFNRQGNYEKSVELAMHDVLPSHIAALSSGEYLVTGYDRANDMPRLYLVGSDGQVIRTLDLPENVSKYDRSDDPNSGKGLLNYSHVLGSILMTAHGDEVLIWRRDARGPILSVGANGSCREIELDVPKNVTLANVLPSDKLWIAQFQEVDHHSDQERKALQTTYYEFDPSDGRLTSKVSISADSSENIPAIIACEEDGTFLSYQSDEKGQTRILTAQ